MTPRAKRNVKSLRGLALATLQALTRAGKTGVAQYIYRLVPTGLKDWARGLLLASAVGRESPLRGSSVIGRHGPVALLPIPAPRADGLGANLIGFVHGELGLAENLRSVARALLSEGFPVAVVNADILDAGRSGDMAEGIPVAVEAPYPVDIYFVNPDQLSAAIAATASVRKTGTWRIGYWFWELPSIPEPWLPSIEAVDEIWVASPFVAKAFQDATNKPVTTIPMVVSPLVNEIPDVGSREDFTYLFSFDFHSYPARKNPYAVVEAFKRAFPQGNEPVRLIIKTINGDVFREAFYDLLACVRGDDRIEVRDGYMPRQHMLELIAACDCYVSLHRSEGFGLGMAEAMALGRAVVATGYSGSLAFMSSTNSVLVPYQLVDVAADEYMHGAGQQWADANVDLAAMAMRSLVEDREFARDLGRRAAMDIATRHSAVVSARVIIDRLEALYASGGRAEESSVRSNRVTDDL